MALAYLCLILLVLVAAAAACFLYLPLTTAIVGALIGAPLLTWLAVLLYGLQRKAQPLRPFDAAEQERNAARLGGEGRHITTADGRILEYLVYGSKRSDARVIGSVPGTLSYSAIDWNHPRAGDLLVSADWSSSTNSWGWAGTSASGGVAGHGSTSPFDVHNTLIASGPDFATGDRSSVPSSNADLAPTLCRLIGVECPQTMTGRVLREALAADEAGLPPAVDEWIVTVSTSNYRLEGRFSRVDGHRYFDGAGVERDPQSAPSGPPPPQ